MQIFLLSVDHKRADLHTRRGVNGSSDQPFPYTVFFSFLIASQNQSNTLRDLMGEGAAIEHLGRRQEGDKKGLYIRDVVTD